MYKQKRLNKQKNKYKKKNKKRILNNKLYKYKEIMNIKK